MSFGRRIGPACGTNGVPCTGVAPTMPSRSSRCLMMNDGRLSYDHSRAHVTRVSRPSSLFRIIPFLIPSGEEISNHSLAIHEQRRQ